MNVQHKLRAKSTALLLSIEARLPRIMTIWFGAAILACAVRIAVSPIHSAPDLSTFLPYMLLVGAPLVSMALALHLVQGWRQPAAAAHPSRPVWPLAQGRPGRGAAASALWQRRDHGLPAGRNAAQRSGARARISGGDAGACRQRSSLAVDAPLRDDARRRAAVQPLHHCLRRGAAPRAAVPAPAGSRSG